jgi:anaerobic dimethyl sulfoxide reductase subunit B (iron-sulfur subunit)
MTQMGFYFDQTRCIGCYTCAVACKDWHDIVSGPVSWLRVETVEDGKFPNLFVAYLISHCYHCDNPPCALACPADAIYKRETDGIVVADGEKCLGNSQCPKLCLNACPWDVPQFSKEEGAKMQKCNLCLERLEQGRQAICVEACPMYALDVRRLDELKAKYGDTVEAEGFTYSEGFKPAVVLRPKRRD